MKGFTHLGLIFTGFLVLTLSASLILLTKGPTQINSKANENIEIGEETISQGQYFDEDEQEVNYFLPPVFTDQQKAHALSLEMPVPNSAKSQQSANKSQVTSLANTTYKVTPLLFVARDKTSDSTDTDALKASFDTIQRWYSGVLEDSSGKIIQISNPVVYNAFYFFDYYKCPGHIDPCGDSYDGLWENVTSQLKTAGFPIYDQGEIFVIFVRGAGGWSGSQGCQWYNWDTNESDCADYWPDPGPPSQTGVSILGDWALDGVKGTPNIDCTNSLGNICSQNPQRGAVAHELGHALGLAHAHNQLGSVMYNWFDFPFVSLFDTPQNNEKSVLLSGNFFTNFPCDMTSKALATSMKKTIKIKKKLTVTTRFENNGWCRWNTSTVSLGLVAENVWGIKKVSLAKNVYPAQYYDFTINEKAPPTGGIFKNFWRLKNGPTFFGEQIGKRVKVTSQ